MTTSRAEADPVLLARLLRAHKCPLEFRQTRGVSDSEELSEVRTFDSYERLKLHLLNVEDVEEMTLLEIEEQNKTIVTEAAEKAEAAPDPDPATATHFVMPEEAPVVSQAMIPKEGEPITLLNAINQTLKEEFRRNPDTFLWGQDVASKEKGGVFSVTKGMQQEFGPGRVFNAPIAEDFHRRHVRMVFRDSGRTFGS